jgi:hypothetical protein
LSVEERRDEIAPSPRMRRMHPHRHLQVVSAPRQPVEDLDGALDDAEARLKSIRELHALAERLREMERRRARSLGARRAT